MYQRYSHLVYGVCLKYLENKAESKDVMMSVFEKMLHKLPDTEVVNVNSWIYMVTKNECFSRLRKREREEKRKEGLKNIQKSSENFMENEGFERLNSRDDFDPTPEMLKKAIKWLPKEQRACLQLFYFQGKNYKEIAAETKLALKQVKSSLQNGKRNLRKLILEEYERLKS